jgi:hypothetical protein
MLRQTQHERGKWQRSEPFTLGLSKGGLCFFFSISNRMPISFRRSHNIVASIFGRPLTPESNQLHSLWQNWLPSLPGGYMRTNISKDWESYRFDY